MVCKILHQNALNFAQKHRPEDLISCVSTNKRNMQSCCHYAASQICDVRFVENPARQCCRGSSAESQRCLLYTDQVRFYSHDSAMRLFGKCFQWTFILQVITWARSFYFPQHSLPSTSLSIRLRIFINQLWSTNSLTCIAPFPNLRCTSLQRML
jgi:hypothetical protein